MSSSILFPTNQYTTSSKSSQQIQKLMVPQDVPQSEIIPYLLNKGHPLQMPFVYKNFALNYKPVLSLICQKAVSQDSDNQILICQSLKTILTKKQNSLTIQERNYIFQMCLQCLNNLNSQANQILTEILEIILKTHPERQVLLTKLENQILELGKNNQPTISKVTSGRLIAIVSKHIGRMIKGQMIDILKRVLSNPQIQARKVWVLQIFPKLLQGLQLEFVELHLQQKIYQTVYDENEEIGMLSLKVIFTNVTKFSVQEQSSRIVKLFIDSLTSKNEKICLMVTQIMGQIYQKLINIIMKNEINCSKFWRSLIELAQSKNQTILNNFSYNLPGILFLTSPYYNTSPVVQIYCELFYEPLTNKMLLASYFHEIAQLFPKKKEQLKQIVYWMFSQLLDQQQEEQYDIQAIKIMNEIIRGLGKSKIIFFQTKKQIENQSQNQNLQKIQKNSISTTSQKTLPVIGTNSRNPSINMNSGINNNSSIMNNGIIDYSFNNNFLQNQLCECLIKYLSLLQNQKNTQWLNLYLNSIKQLVQYFPLEFIQNFLLPKIYMLVRIKCSSTQLLMQIIVLLIKRDISSFMNLYSSKINVEFSKSIRAHERQAAIYFFYHCCLNFSLQTFQEYKLGEKFLYFNNDKSFQNKLLFIKFLPRIQYYFNRQQKIQNAIIINKLMKDSDSQIAEVILKQWQLLQQTDFTQRQQVRELIMHQSKAWKQKQKQISLHLLQLQPIKSLKPFLNNRRQSKQLKKEQLLKKRIQTTKSKTKMLIKQIPKKKGLINVNVNLGSKNTTMTNFRKNS